MTFWPWDHDFNLWLWPAPLRMSNISDLELWAWPYNSEQPAPERSSDPSPQSSCPSHFHNSVIHFALSQKNSERSSHRLSTTKYTTIYTRFLQQNTQQLTLVFYNKIQEFSIREELIHPVFLNIECPSRCACNFCAKVQEGKHKSSISQQFLYRFCSFSSGLFR